MKAVLASTYIFREAMYYLFPDDTNAHKYVIGKEKVNNTVIFPRVTFTYESTVLPEFFLPFSLAAKCAFVEFTEI